MLDHWRDFGVGGGNVSVFAWDRSICGGVRTYLNVHNSPAHADMAFYLAGCTSMKDADTRLACFDEAVNNFSAVNAIVPDAAVCRRVSETDKRLSCFDEAVANVPVVQVWKNDATRELEAQAKRKADAQGECARRGEPKIGMTGEELEASCWGRPLRIVKKTTASGVEESYIYSIDRIVRLLNNRIAEITEGR